MFLAIAWPLTAAADSNDFYLSLLHRGISHYDAGQYETGARELRTAAFGLVDAIPQFETAQIYLALASDHLKIEADARRAAQRVIAADRIARRYGSLAIPSATRTAFDQLTARLLTSDQVAFLRGSPSPTPPPVPAPQHSSAPAPTTPQPTTAPVPAPPQPTANPKPPPAPVPVPQSKPIPQPQPQPQQQPQPQPTAPRPVDINAQMAQGDTALAGNNLPAARAIYQSVINQPSLDHETLLRIGEQSYRARDFATAVRAFTRSGFNSGEQPYHYYFAVALYETRQYEAARRELAEALPYIEVTQDVAQYRAKIESGGR
jgi:tetratricopeptide (TPR) repeat protein